MSDGLAARLIMSGHKGRQEFILGSNDFIIGRSLDNELELVDSLVSRRHTKIVKDTESYRCVDLNSSNGTYVNGQRVSEKILSTGDSIRIGTTVLTFEDPNEPVSSDGIQIGDFDFESEMSPVTSTIATLPLPAPDPGSTRSSTTVSVRSSTCGTASTMNRNPPQPESTRMEHVTARRRRAQRKLRPALMTIVPLSARVCLTDRE